MDDQTPAILIAPIKKEEELSEEDQADYQPPMKTDLISITDLPTFSQSSNIPYPIVMFENKFQTGLDKSLNEQTSTSMAKKELRDTTGMDDNDIHFESKDKSHCYQVSSSNKPHTFTSPKLKSENHEADAKYEVVTVENVSPVSDSKYNIPEHMSGMAFMDTKPISYPEETTENLLITSLKQEDTGTPLSQDMRSESTTSSKRKFICKVCGKAFRQSSDLKIHNRIHTGEKPYTCNTCGKSFARNGDLTAHSRIHCGEKPYECKVCGKAFRQCSDLKVHNQIHSGEKPYKCNICGKSFTQKSGLITHCLTHSDERPYECKVCGKAFKKSNDLKNHNRIHTGERPHICNICEKSFARIDHLTVHSRTHSGERPFECKVCGKAFLESSKLKRHNRIHSGETPYKCNTCGKSFTRNDHLRIHSQTHNGERPNECKVCGKVFRCSIGLKNHSRIHSEERS